MCGHRHGLLDWPSRVPIPGCGGPSTSTARLLAAREMPTGGTALLASSKPVSVPFPRWAVCDSNHLPDLLFAICSVDGIDYGTRYLVPNHVKASRDQSTSHRSGGMRCR